MFQYYGHIHVYSPGAGADNPLGPKYFLNHKFSVHLLISSKFLPFNYIFLFFPIPMHGRPKLICRKIGQGFPRDMIYINFVELYSQILHTKFQDHRPSGSGKEDF